MYLDLPTSVYMHYVAVRHKMAEKDHVYCPLKTASLWGLFVLHCLHPNWKEPERLAQPRTPFMCANAIPTECIGRGKHITEHQSNVLRINYFPNSSKRLKKKKGRLYGWQKLASKADDGFEQQFAVFLCFEWQPKCLPVILGKAKNSKFAFGFCFFFFVIF